MANYYTKFSMTFSLPSQEAEDYALSLCQRASIARDNEEYEADDIPVELREWVEGWTFDCESDHSGSPGIWCHSEEAGGQDACAFFIQHLLQKYCPQEHCGFEWAHDCSKPRLDGFGGGAVWISAVGVQFFGTSQWLQERSESKLTEQEFLDAAQKRSLEGTITDFELSSHASDCASRQHTASECTCGLADRLAAQEKEGA